jgi:hypothetical protein
VTENDQKGQLKCSQKQKKFNDKKYDEERGSDKRNKSDANSTNEESADVLGFW